MNNSLKRKIMTRVYLEYTKSTFLAYPDYFMSAIFIVTALMLVSIRDVFVNLTSVTEHNFSGVFGFLFSAIQNTSWVLQLLIAGFVLRIAFSGAKIAHKNIKTNWFGAKFRY